MRIINTIPFTVTIVYSSKATSRAVYVSQRQWRGTKGERSVECMRLMDDRLLRRLQAGNDVGRTVLAVVGRRS